MSCLPYGVRCGGVSANQICISSMTKTETWEYCAGDTWHFWFKFLTSPSQVSSSALPGVPFLSNSLLLGYAPLSNTRRFLGGGGMLSLRAVRCILQTLNKVKGLHNYHKFYQHPPAYYTKKRVYSGHLNLPIRQLEQERDLNYFM